MSGVSSWTILSPILRHWPYRLLFFGIGAAALSLPIRSVQNSWPGSARRVSNLLLSGQCLAVVATAVFVLWSLDWRIHPSLVAQNQWIESFWHFFADDFFAEIALGLTVIALIYTGDATSASLGIRLPKLAGPIAAKSPKLSAVILLLVIACAYVMLHSIAGPVSRALEAKVSGGSAVAGTMDFTGWAVQQTIAQIGTFGAPLFLLWFGLFVPVIEEVFFRGFYFSTLSGKTSTGVALVVQALFFAAVHVDIFRLPYLVVLGLTLGYLVKRTSSLLPAVLLHVAINVFSLLPVLS